MLKPSTKKKRYKQLDKHGYSPKYKELKYKDLTSGMRKRIKKKDWYA